MAAKFVVKKGPTGKFRFSLHGENGRVIASSETYNSKAACLNGIKAVKGAVGGADIEDQTTKAWADEQAKLKAATKTAAKAAKKAIKQAAETPRGADEQAKLKAATKTAAKAAKKAIKQAADTARPRGTVA
jgi:uncharacterized protein YegP (UPF0339 family)